MIFATIGNDHRQFPRFSSFIHHVLKSTDSQVFYPNTGIPLLILLIQDLYLLILLHVKSLTIYYLMPL